MSRFTLDRLMPCVTTAFLCGAVLICLPHSAEAQRYGETADVGSLIAVIDSNAETYAKAMACRELARVGDERAVEALSGLLDHAELASYARSALLNIDAAEVDSALRAALDELDGEFLIGVIDTIGIRRDQNANAALADLIQHEIPQVRAAAAKALGRIGSPESASALIAALDHEDIDTRASVGWACLECANHLYREAQFENSQFLELLIAVDAANLPPTIKLSAIGHMIRLGADPDGELLQSLLASDDDDAFETGILVSRELIPTPTSQLVSAFDNSDEDRRIQLVAVLGEIGDESAMPLLVEAAGDESQLIRKQAMLSLGSFQSSEVTSALLAGMRDRDIDVANAAIDSLAVSRDPDIDDLIIDMLISGNETLAERAIVAVGRRRIHAAQDVLFPLAESDGLLQRAAIAALGSTVELSELRKLIRMSLSADESLREDFNQSIAIATARLPKDESASLMTSLLAESTIDQQVRLLEWLTSLGGEVALETVVSAAASDEDPIRDAATRLLGTWTSGEVATALAVLVEQPFEPKYKIRLLRGYIRVARQLDIDMHQRHEICRHVLQLAERDDERGLVLDAIRRYPSAEGLVIANEMLQIPSQRNQAINVIRTIAPRTIENDPYLSAIVLNRSLAEFSQSQHANDLSNSLATALNNNQLAESEEGFVELFDGETFKGWHGNLDHFRIEDEQIIAGSLDTPIEQNEFLRTDENFEDFELRLQFKLLGEQPNAGVQIRTQEIPDHHEVSGYQADLGPGWWGCLYDESRRRRVLAGPPAEMRGAPVDENEWNDYRILCEGKRIRLWINGIQTVDYVETEDEIPLEGIIAVQVHSGDPMEARYRNIRIKVLNGE